MLFKSTGILRYGGNHSLRVVTDQQLADYYRSMIPKTISTNRPRWPAHITVVREINGMEVDKPTDFTAWGRYEGEEVEFYYDNYVHSGKVYYWLNCFCQRLEEIRLELGLKCHSRYTRPPEGFRKCFHMTIANLKECPCETNKKQN